MELTFQNKKSLYWIIAIFIAMNCVAIYKEAYWFSLFPIGLAIIGLLFTRFDKFLLLVSFLTPLSINLENLNMGFGMSLPTEPLLIIACILIVFKLASGYKIDRRIINHPISILLLINLIWMCLTCITSVRPEVSFKFFFSRLWFVLPLFFWGIILFKKRENIFKYTWLYTSGLLIVIVYTVIHHSLYGFADKPAHWVMQPFMKDHTSYGALVAFFVPFTFIQVFKNSSRKLSVRLLIVGVFIIFMAGLIFSYTRAAWVSIVVSLISYLLIHFRVKLYQLTIIGLVIFGGLFTFQNEILQKLAKNKQDSSEDFAEHVKSISNVASDASNLERLNRWSCALKMFREKPITGWGPGTYMFEYAPFQESGDLTIISTNFGNMGNAHSEYLGPLSESGLFGMLTILALFIGILYKGIKLYYQIDGTLKYLLLSIILGLITYLAHGFLNNFLDTDKASVPFWGFAAMIVAIDIYHKKPSQGFSR